MAENTAFEAITTRSAWYAGEALAKYDAVEYGAAGKFVKATGSKPFAGIVQYGCDEADQMATVVRGAFPGVAESPVEAGDLVGVSAGKFKKASGSAAVGVALTPAKAADDLFTVQILETPVAAG